jgi:hypothetical protein
MAFQFSAGTAVFRGGTAPCPVGPFERFSDSYVNAGFLQGSIEHFGAFFAGSPRTAAEAACP